VEDTPRPSIEDEPLHSFKFPSDESPRSRQKHSTQPGVGGPKHRPRSGGKGLTLGHLTRVNRFELGVSRKLERHNQQPTVGDRACLFITHTETSCNASPPPHPNQSLSFSSDRSFQHMKHMCLNLQFNGSHIQSVCIFRSRVGVILI
jgi:hypothetical protein